MCLLFLSSNLCRLPCPSPNTRKLGAPQPMFHKSPLVFQQKRGRYLILSIGNKTGTKQRNQTRTKQNQGKSRINLRGSSSSISRCSELFWKALHFQRPFLSISTRGIYGLRL